MNTMDAYIPEEETIADRNQRLNKFGSLAVAAGGGALAESYSRRRRRTRANTVFPMVFAQDTPRNQTLCSLMSEVLLRKLELKTVLRPGETRPSSAHGRREPLLQYLDQREAISLRWNFPRDTNLSSIHVPTLFIIRSLTNPSSSSRIDSIIDTVAYRGCGSVELVSCDDDLSSNDIMKLALRHVASRLSSGTPLYLVGADGTIDSLLRYVEEEDLVPTPIEGIILILSKHLERAHATTDGCRTWSYSSGGANGVPFLWLDLDSITPILTSWVWRNNPNVIHVKVMEDEGVSRDSYDTWVARSVLAFVDSTAAVRLRNNFLRSHL